ncbi:sensor histidine kinase [Thalassobellus citreus]|uniref:sensor histidine kinase n=1 Tax=Thalassobellus citreus TaxID=3367752 RepID=UPI0037986F9F
MKKALVSLIILFFFFNKIQSQENFSTQDSIINKIEIFILNNQLDSVLNVISQQKKTPYIESLNRIYKNENPSYIDYYEFISSLGNRHEVDYIDVSNYINSNINPPEDKDYIDLDYVNIKWLQVSKLRDEASIGEASNEQEKLEAYISQFDKNDTNTIKAQLLVSTHQMVMYQIEENVEKGKKLCLKNLEKAKELGDGRLRIIFLYHLCDFYILERKLDEYIDASEQSLGIEKQLINKSDYYIGTIMHLVDAYIYKGGYENRVDELLNLLYGNPETKVDSYCYYAKYISVLNIDSPKVKLIFNQFEVSNVLEFCEKIKREAKEVLNPNDFFHVLNESSKALALYGFYDEALKYKNECVTLTRKIYSQDLSQSLSSFETKQAIKEKELEIEQANKLSKLYVIIISLIVSLLLIVFVFLLRKQKQSKVLELKNNQINKAIKEKELLVKEVHHRVKNNFQIIASLLELQAKGLEDEKALAFANESKSRLKSMALIHKKLYHGEDGLINFEKYIKMLVKEISSVYVLNKNVDTHIFVNNVFFDIDTAIPLGLIVNELITNAYKYAFIDGLKGRLDISIKRVDKENYKLIVSDNGSGIPDDFNINEAKSFGLNLVTRLVKQLRGKLFFNNNDGANFEIIFKDVQARKVID